MEEREIKVTVHIPATQMFGMPYVVQIISTPPSPKSQWVNNKEYLNCLRKCNFGISLLAL